MTTPYLHCRYCDWFCRRFYRCRPQGDRLLFHVMAAHEAEYLEAQGVQDWQAAAEKEAAEEASDQHETLS